MSWSDHVHPHGPLVELAPGFWQVTGSMPRGALRRNMAIWRAGDGLVIHSCVCLEQAGMAAIEALGEPRILVVPNRFHRHDAVRFRERYPRIRVVAAPGTRAQVEKVIAVDADAREALDGLGTECLLAPGLKPWEYVFRVPTDDGRHGLVFADALFNHKHAAGFEGWILRNITGSTGAFGITRLGRWMMLRDRALFAGFLRELADAEGLAAISVAHGEALVDDPAGALRQAAERV